MEAAATTARRLPARGVRAAAEPGRRSAGQRRGHHRGDGVGGGGGGRRPPAARAVPDRLPARGPGAAVGLRGPDPRDAGGDRHPRGAVHHHLRHARHGARRGGTGTRSRARPPSPPPCCATARCAGTYNKTLLPTYDLFSESRTFTAGTNPGALWRIGGVVAGICICEDLWSGDGPPELQAANGAQILLVPNGSPYYRDKRMSRSTTAAEVALRNGIPVIYVNCVGGVDDLVFDGGSIFADPDGSIRYLGPQFDIGPLLARRAGGAATAAGRLAGHGAHADPGSARADTPARRRAPVRGDGGDLAGARHRRARLRPRQRLREGDPRAVRRHRRGGGRQRGGRCPRAPRT